MVEDADTETEKFPFETGNGDQPAAVVHKIAPDRSRALAMLALRCEY